MDSAIRIKGLSKQFDDVRAVNDLSLDVSAGEVFGFLGPNGAGKTTTIRCLLGFIKPTAGSIELLGKPTTGSPDGVLSRIGYIPGEFGLWPHMTGGAVLSYLASLRPVAHPQRESLLRRFELTENELARPVKTYSRGMRQKLALVQAFEHEPQLVILDEPTEGLDPLMQDRFVDLLATFRAAGGTTLMSSHILSEVEAVATKVGVIRAGQLIRVGAPSQLAGSHTHACSLIFTDLPPLSKLSNMQGITQLRSTEHTVRFVYTGELQDLLRSVADMNPASCTIEPPSLTDSFIGLYSK